MAMGERTRCPVGPPGWARLTLTIDGEAPMRYFDVTPDAALEYR